MRQLVFLLVFASNAIAGPNCAGEFDYYILSLSWSPNWCAIEGDARGSPQCDDFAGHGWVLHGLWPQSENGYPSNCRTAHRPPSRAMTAAMADIMGTAGLAWHQWKKHGTCSGLPARDYYALARLAYGAVNRPAVFRKLSQPVRLPATVVEEAFLKDNPAWRSDMLTITCRDGRIQEARLCLSKDLAPISCGRGVVRDCRMRDALFDPIR